MHWNGQLWRASPEDLNLRSHIEGRYGKRFIPPDMTIQDYPVTFDELEPHFDHFEKVCGVSGTAGNLRGQIKPGGNPFEGPRSDEFPTPPLPAIYAPRLFEKAAAELGYKSFPRTGGEQLDRLHEPLRRAAGALQSLRLLRALRLLPLLQGIAPDDDPADSSGSLQPGGANERLCDENLAWITRGNVATGCSVHRRERT